MKKILVKHITLLAALCSLFGSQTVAQPQRVMISGTVTDYDNQPVDFVTVNHKGTQNAVQTNRDGKYAITVRSTSQSVILSFQLVGYRTEERTVDASANRSLNIRLLRDTAQLNSVTVFGVQNQTDMNMNIGAKNIRGAVAAGGDKTIGMLLTTAGVSSTSELTTQYSVRGGSYDENIIYVNGVEVYRPLLIRSGQQEGLSFINSDMVGSVSFSTGGFEARYGDKMSSALDISYKQPQSFEGGFSASLMGGSAYVGNRSRNFSQITGIRYKATKLLLNTLDVEADYQPSFIDLQSFMSYNLSDNCRIDFLGNASQTKYKFIPKERASTFGTLSMSKSLTMFYDGWEDDKFLTCFGALSLRTKPAKDLELNLIASAFISDEQENYDINCEYRLTDKNLESGGESGEGGDLIAIGTFFEHARNLLQVKVKNISHTGSYKFDTGTLTQKLSWGFTLQHEAISDRISEWEMRDSAGYSIPYLPNRDRVQVYSTLRSVNSLSAMRYTGYLQDAISWHTAPGNFRFTGGLRFNHWEFNSQTLFSPRFSLAFIPGRNSNLTFRGAFGVYYQAPFYKELQKRISASEGDSIMLNSEIKAQKSIHWVFGGDYSFRALEDKRPFKFSTELYYKTITDLIPYKVNNVKIRYAGENMGTGSIMGVDFRLFGEFIKGTDNWISLSFMKARQEIDGEVSPMPTDQLFNLSIFFQDYIPGFERLRGSLLGHLAQGLPAYPPGGNDYGNNAMRSTSYRRLDLGLTYLLIGEDFDIRQRSAFWGVFRSLTIGVEVFNLFDIQNISAYSWITDIFNQQHSVPNYLTSRLLNLTITAQF